jgi:DNA-binding winged helix-turn-helix (wHTH) protein
MLLCNSINQPVNKECILKHLWDEDFFRQRELALNNIISGLRKKLKNDKGIDIINIPKIGWKLIVQ